MSTTQSTVKAVKDREKFIADHLAGVPDAYTDAHLGLDPAQWEAEAAKIKTTVAADLQSYREQNPPPPAKPPGRWDWVKMPNEAPKDEAPKGGKGRFDFIKFSAA